MESDDRRTPLSTLSVKQSLVTLGASEATIEVPLVGSDVIHHRTIIGVTVNPQIIEPLAATSRMVRIPIDV